LESSQSVDIAGCCAGVLVVHLDYVSLVDPEVVFIVVVCLPFGHEHSPHHLGVGVIADSVATVGRVIVKEALIFVFGCASLVPIPVIEIGSLNLIDPFAASGYENGRTCFNSSVVRHVCEGSPFCLETD